MCAAKDNWFSSVTPRFLAVQAPDTDIVSIVPNIDGVTV